MKTRWTLVPVLASLGVLASCGVAESSGSSPTTTPGPATSSSVPAVTATILAKSQVNDLNLGASASDGLWKVLLTTHGSSDFYVVDNKFDPRSDTGWHSHLGPSLVIVVAGTVTNYTSDDPACAPHVYHQGSNFIDAGGSDSHLLRNEGTVAAETIAVQLLPAGATRRIPKPAPPNCPKG